MKRISLILLLMWALPAFAQSWTIEQVPNTRLQSDSIHVSDPDSLIDDADEARISLACMGVRDSVDIFIVALNSIGDDDPRDFATNLFRKWGIGERSKDNGLLLLMVYDQHAIEIETGYGTEGILPDVICKRVIDEAIIPLMKEGRYSAGMREGAFGLVKLLGGSSDVPGVGMVADYGQVQYPTVPEPTLQDSFPWGLMGSIAFITMFVGFINMVLGWIRSRKNKKKGAAIAQSNSLTLADGTNFVDGINGKSAQWNGNAWEHHGCLRYIVLCLSALAFFLFGSVLIEGGSDPSSYGRKMWLVLALWLTLVCVWHNRRSIRQAKSKAASAVRPSQMYEKAMNNGVSMITMICAPWVGYFFYKMYKRYIKESADLCNCPECGQQMKPVDLLNRLTDKQKKENEIGSMKYRHYRCSNGHETLVADKGIAYTKYSACSACGARTKKEIKTVTLKEATHYSSGLRQTTYHCQYCGHEEVAQVSIPRLQDTSSSSGGSSSGGWSGGSHSSGGSFGGGHSGGGGASGRW